MDPLSFTASVIAVLTLTGTVIKSLNEIRTALKNAPDDLLTLLDEMTDFQYVLRSIRDMAFDSSPNAFSELSRLASRAKQKLDELENILHYQILRHVPAAGEKPEVPRLRWLRVRGKVGAIRECLRHIGSQLGTALASITARGALTANARLETIEFFVKELGSGQRRMIIEMARSTELALVPSGALSERQRSLRVSSDHDSDDTSLEITNAIVSGMSSQPVEITAGREASRIVASSATEWQCKPWCACLCHKRQRWHMPKSLQVLFGDLHLYYGTFFSKTACTERMCRRPSVQTMKVTYHFPTWLAACGIMADLGGQSSCLRTVRTVSKDALIMTYAQTGDLEGIKQLFRSGSASPLDLDPDGWSPLHWAVLFGHTSVCRLLMQAGADPYTVRTGVWTPICEILLWASWGDAVVYEIFPLWEAIPEQGLSRLHKIILNILPGDVECELAVSTADIDTQDIDGQTPLMVAVRLRKDEVVQSLLKYKANASLADVHGFSPLMLATRKGKASLIDDLVVAGAHLQSTDSSGDSALVYAGYYGKKEAAARLMYHESKLETKSKDFLKLAEEYGYGSRTVEDITDEPGECDSVGESDLEDSGDVSDQSYDLDSVDELDLEDTEDFADPLETFSTHPS